MPAAVEFLLLAALVSCARVCCAAGAGAGVVNISNVLPRLDSSGAIMDMHDGNMVVKGGVWYWYAAGYGGCRERPGSEGCAGGFHGCGFFNNHTVNLFTSTDLVNWTPHGNVLPEANRVDAILFSPKVLYNAQTEMWVLWYNFDPKYSYGVRPLSWQLHHFTTATTTIGPRRTHRPPSHAYTTPT